MSLSITDKLKKYIRKNGGSPAGAQTISELIDKLPESGGSGGGNAIFDCSIDTTSQTLTLSGSYDDVVTAINNGQMPIVRMRQHPMADEYSYMYYMMNSVDSSDTMNFKYYVAFGALASTTASSIVMFSASNSWEPLSSTLST